MKKTSNFQIFSLFHTCEKNACMIVKSMKAFNKILMVIGYWSGDEAVGLSQYGHIMNMYLILKHILYSHIHYIIEKIPTKCFCTLSMNTFYNYNVWPLNQELMP